MTALSALKNKQYLTVNNLLEVKASMLKNYNDKGMNRIIRSSLIHAVDLIKKNDNQCDEKVAQYSSEIIQYLKIIYYHERLIKEYKNIDVANGFIIILKKEYELFKNTSIFYWLDLTMLEFLDSIEVDKYLEKNTDFIGNTIIWIENLIDKLYEGS